MSSAEQIQNQMKEQNEQSRLVFEENKKLHEGLAEIEEKTLLRQKSYAEEVKKYIIFFFFFRNILSYFSFFISSYFLLFF